MSKLKDRFKCKELWEKEWQGMPEFIQEDQIGFRTIHVHFKNEKDVSKFAKLIEQNITDKTKFVWYPKMKPTKLKSKIYIDSNKKK